MSETRSAVHSIRHCDLTFYWPQNPLCGLVTRLGCVIKFPPFTWSSVRTCGRHGIHSHPSGSNSFMNLLSLCNFILSRHRKRLPRPFISFIHWHVFFLLPFINILKLKFFLIHSFFFLLLFVYLNLSLPLSSSSKTTVAGFSLADSGAHITWQMGVRHATGRCIMLSPTLVSGHSISNSHFWPWPLIDASVCW